MKEPIFRSTGLGDVTNHLSEFIDFSLNVSIDERHPRGIYALAIIACTSKLESIFEETLVNWCESKPDNQSYNQRVLDKIRKDISRSTGLEKWKEWIKIIFDIELPNILVDEWESLKKLFQLRNQIAHGRTTKFRQYYKQDGKFIGMEMEESGYREIFKFLLKENIISVPEGSIPTVNSILSKQVVEHFSNIVEAALEQLSGHSGFEAIKYYQKSSQPYRVTSDFSSSEDFDLIREVDY